MSDVKIYPIVVALRLPNAKPVYLNAIQKADADGTFEKAGLTTALRVSNYLAQFMTEAAGLSALRENMSYSASRIMQIFGVNKHSAAVTQAEANTLAHNPEALAERVYGLGNPKMAHTLGNIEVGDGYKFRGGAALQTTGRDAYKRWGDILGVDLVAHPDLICDPKYILLPSLFEWKAKNCNDMADKNDQRGITKAINGGYNGWTDRVAWFNKVWLLIASVDTVKPSDVAEIDANVIWLQNTLNTLGANPTVDVDGRMGPATETAIRKYQSDNKLAIDGIAGDSTKASMQLRLDTTGGAAKTVVSAPPPVAQPATIKKSGITIASAAAAGTTIIDKVQEVSPMFASIPWAQYVLFGAVALGITLWVAGYLWQKHQESTPISI